MTFDDPQALETPPEDFTRSVKEALESLYDLPALQRHPLAQGRAEVGQPGESAGQRLRSELMSAIEALNPGPATPFRSPRARTFHLLHLRYVEGMTVQETARELGLSERQAYRDLRHADDSVAALLWARRVKPQMAVPPNEGRLSSIRAEVDRLEPKSRPVDLGQLLQRVLRAVERLAAQRGTIFVTEAPAEPVHASADPLLAQQILTHLLSNAVQQAQPGQLHVSVMPRLEGTAISLRYQPEDPAGHGTIVKDVVSQLADRLGWKIAEEERSDGARTVVIDTVSCGPSVLVIDDNQGLVELLERYLTGHACRVWTATSGGEGLELASQLIPDAIILDVMMPEMDGWELLQRLRAHPPTAAIPVIICSVFDDPELAYSLGASLCVPKPVERADILAALRQLGVL